MNIIEVKNLSKSFGNLQVLSNVNLSVAEGERIVIIGGSGCGKSVFLRCLELLETPNEGQIFIDGQEITAEDADIDKIRQSMGMVYQKFYLFSNMNVLENLCIAPMTLLKMPESEAHTMAMDLLAQVGLTSKANSYPDVLSGGQQQRIAICRSLMMNPKVLLFDEPTSALDPTMVGEVLAVIRMLAKHNLTMIIVTHEMNFAQEVATRVLFFADGGIYEQGTPKEIFDNPKREKTIAFINKEKYFNYEIHERSFDLMEMQGGIWIFTEKYGIKRKEALRLQLCCEEMIYELIAKCYDAADAINIVIDVIYNEKSRKIDLTFTYTGRQYNPFEADESEFEDNIGITILRNVAKNVAHTYEGDLNKLRFQLNI